jgi:hypothetical protein
VHMCASHLKFITRLTYFHEIWYRYYVTAGSHTWDYASLSLPAPLILNVKFTLQNITTAQRGSRGKLISVIGHKSKSQASQINDVILIFMRPSSHNQRCEQHQKRLYDVPTGLVASCIHEYVLLICTDGLLRS